MHGDSLVTFDDGVTKRDAEHSSIAWDDLSRQHRFGLPDLEDRTRGSSSGCSIDGIGGSLHSERGRPLHRQTHRDTRSGLAIRMRHIPIRPGTTRGGRSEGRAAITRIPGVAHWGEMNRHRQTQNRQLAIMSHRIGGEIDGLFTYSHVRFGLITT